VVEENPVMNSTRDEILAKIRAALGDVPRGEMPEATEIVRDYLHVSNQSREQILELFIDRLIDYKATVGRVAPRDLSRAIAAACDRRGIRRLAVPPDLADGWAPEGVEVVRDRGLSHRELDAVDGVLTACALAIAQTGTIILDGGPGQGRRALTLLPDYHLCVVRADQVVGLVPEGVRRLTADSKRPMTWISGPSATSDIELNRVEGVHGPRTLEVLVVDDEAS
jgi:L-lactate dehydrogenase complex protein LldG